MFARFLSGLLGPKPSGSQPPEHGDEDRPAVEVLAFLMAPEVLSDASDMHIKERHRPMLRKYAQKAADALEHSPLAKHEDTRFMFKALHRELLIEADAPSGNAPAKQKLLNNDWGHHASEQFQKYANAGDIRVSSAAARLVLDRLKKSDLPAILTPGEKAVAYIGISV
ncbi:MAG: hypothetical protein AAF556_00185 [Pseudomonadota bacterium]